MIIYILPYKHDVKVEGSYGKTHDLITLENLRDGNILILVKK